MSENKITVKPLIERLRSNAELPICPFDKRSPEYYTTPNDKPCKFCGGEPEGPDKCTGADMRIMSEAADAIATKDERIAELEFELTKLVRNAGEVSKLGAVTGRQWTLLACSLITARAALEGGK